MRISDCSSDVCSSDLPKFGLVLMRSRSCVVNAVIRRQIEVRCNFRPLVNCNIILDLIQFLILPLSLPHSDTVQQRSEERRVGTECVSTCRSRGSPYHYKNK